MDQDIFCSSLCFNNFASYHKLFKLGEKLRILDLIPPMIIGTVVGGGDRGNSPALDRTI